MCTAQDMVRVRCTAAVSCHVLFVCGALRSVTEAESSRLPQKLDVTTQFSAPGRMVGEVGGLVFDRNCCASAVLVSCRTARAWSVRA